MESENWEIELKFHLDDPNLLAERLSQMGFQAGASHSHEDVYFRHPCRDFKATDEALRLRKVDQWACITYKGPRLTGPVKIREEIELSVDVGSLSQWNSLVDRLGFRPLPSVRKKRCEYKTAAPEFSGLTVVIDRVEELGDFAEIEIVVADKQLMQAARERILALANQLGLTKIQPLSYLDQLQAIRGS